MIFNGRVNEEMNDKNKRDKKVLVMGATVIDIIMEIAQLPVSGQDVLAKQRGKNIGGCAFNVAAVLKYFQIPMDFLTPIGTGPNGQWIQETVRRLSYTGYVFDSSTDNGWNLSLVEQNGERTFITVSGVESNWKREWFQGINFSDYTHIYVSGYELEGDSGKVILSALNEGVTSQTILFDPGPRIAFISPEVWKGMLELPLILTINADEANQLYQESDEVKQAEEIYRQVQSPIILRKGERGTACFDGQTFFHVPAIPTEVIDTIGAGDAHAGAFLSGLYKGQTLRESIQLANHIASQVVHQQGGTFIGFTGNKSNLV